MNKISRIIFHIDMNCFFASCEISVNPDLKNKPIIVAHEDILDRGLILSPSYEARKFGIYTTMRVFEAKKLCPNVIVVNPTYGLYDKYSQAFYDYLEGISPNIKIEMASCDEAYVDMSEVCSGPETIDLAKKIQDDILKKLSLPCSIGIAPNKFLAKMASDMKKPMGITVLRKRELEEKMWCLPIEDMMGIGKKTSPRLKAMGIKTIGDFVNYKDKEYLIKVFGNNFVSSMLEKCYGIDNTPVITDYGLRQSVSCDHTYMEDVQNVKILYDTIRALCNSIAFSIQKDNQLAMNIGIKFRYNNFQATNRSKPFDKPTNDEYQLYRYAKDVFDDYYDEKMGIRLIGVFVNRLVDDNHEVKQISIFDDFNELEKTEKIKKIINTINDTVGKDLLNKGMKVKK